MTGWAAGATLAAVALVTFLTRALPFWVFRNQDRPSRVLTDLNRLLPPAVIAILVVFCLQAIRFHSCGSWLPQLISLSLVVLLHVWKRNNILSIGVGTVVYMLLVQGVFQV